MNLHIKNTTRYIGIFCVFLIYSISLQAQQKEFQWSINAGAGIQNYYGDLSYKFINIKSLEPGFHLGINRHFGERLSLGFYYMNGSVTGNDRANQWLFDNTPENNSNFSRSLNFKTDFHDVNLLFKIKTLKSTAVVNPYFVVGFGVGKFNTYADLLDENDNRYYYWSDNTIRNLSETDSLSNTAIVIEQDETYETELYKLDNNNSYSPWKFQVPVGLGLSFRFSERISLDVEALYTYNFTDYIDDAGNETIAPISGSEFDSYAANPANNITNSRGNANNWNDAYLYTSASLVVKFGAKKSKFNGLVFYPGNYIATNKVEEKTVDLIDVTGQYSSDSIDSKKDSLLLSQNTKEVKASSNAKTPAIQKDSLQGNNVIINIVNNGIYIDLSSHKINNNSPEHNETTNNYNGTNSGNPKIDSIITEIEKILIIDSIPTPTIAPDTSFRIDTLANLSIDSNLTPIDTLLKDTTVESIDTIKQPVSTQNLDSIFKDVKFAPKNIDSSSIQLSKDSVLMVDSDSLKSTDFVVDTTIQIATDTLIELHDSIVRHPITGAITDTIKRIITIDSTQIVNSDSLKSTDFVFDTTVQIATDTLIELHDSIIRHPITGVITDTIKRKITIDSTQIINSDSLKSTDFVVDTTVQIATDTLIELHDSIVLHPITGLVIDTIKTAVVPTVIKKDTLVTSTKIIIKDTIIQSNNTAKTDSILNALKLQQAAFQNNQENEMQQLKSAQIQQQAKLDSIRIQGNEILNLLNNFNATPITVNERIVRDSNNLDSVYFLFNILQNDIQSLNNKINSIAIDSTQGNQRLVTPPLSEVEKTVVDSTSIYNIERYLADFEASIVYKIDSINALSRIEMPSLETDTTQIYNLDRVVRQMDSRVMDMEINQNMKMDSLLFKQNLSNIALQQQLASLNESIEKGKVVATDTSTIPITQNNNEYQAQNEAINQKLNELTEMVRLMQVVPKIEISETPIPTPAPTPTKLDSVVSDTTVTIDSMAIVQENISDSLLIEDTLIDNSNSDTIKTSLEDTITSTTSNSALQLLEDERNQYKKEMDEMKVLFQNSVKEIEQLLIALKEEKVADKKEVIVQESPTTKPQVQAQPIMPAQVNIFFGSNKFEISPQYFAQLDDFAAKTRSNSNYTIEIRGYSDPSGNAAYNLQLSQKRANQVKDYLVYNKGFLPSQIRVLSMGEESSSDSQYSRRVEVELKVF